MCHALLIANDDLVTDSEVIFDLDKLKNAEKEIRHIKCENCKRRIRYYVND